MAGFLIKLADWNFTHRAGSEQAEFSHRRLITRPAIIA
jgi:hypothetical protein